MMAFRPCVDVEICVALPRITNRSHNAPYSPMASLLKAGFAMFMALTPLGNPEVATVMASKPSRLLSTLKQEEISCLRLTCPLNSSNKKVSHFNFTPGMPHTQRVSYNLANCASGIACNHSSRIQ